MAKAQWLSVLIYEPARKVIHEWPYGVRKDLGDVLTKLQKGELVGMPDVRPMSSVGKGVCEIRIRASSGAYRVFYFIQGALGICVFHAFTKKTQQTPNKEIVTAKERLNSFLKELES
jgi:phage-related protein